MFSLQLTALDEPKGVANQATVSEDADRQAEAQYYLGLLQKLKPKEKEKKERKSSGISFSILFHFHSFR